MATILVTGAKGCIGAWALRALLDGGHTPIAYDLPGNMHRLDLILGDDVARVKFIEGDILNGDALKAAVEANGVTHILHLAALQVPSARANPVLGAQVNVVGTVNVFETARAAGIKHIAYASSIAVYGPQPTPDPRTLYGVWKLADEGMARVYHQDHGIGSIGLRPNIVYGPGRDFGMTSTPTTAMLAAAAGKDYHIGFANTMLYHMARDAGAWCARSALVDDFGRAAVFDPPGVWADTAKIASTIESIVPGVKVTFDPLVLPFPDYYDTSALAGAIGAIEVTPLEQGIAETIETFRKALAAGKLQPPA